MEENKALFEEAKKALEFAYAPYSHFTVGAALLSASGKIYHGCNIENASYGATCCAERTAIYKAVSQGEREFLKIAVVAGDSSTASPCGICRQVLWEFMPGGEVILEMGQGELAVYKVKELLPLGFELAKDNT
jgi:cytidine deaminase